jgi:hypothetical protein
MRLWFNAIVSVSSRVMEIAVSFMVVFRFVVKGQWLHCSGGRLIVGSECARSLTHR